MSRILSWPRSWKLEARADAGILVFCSVADPERFDADPDPTFQADEDPEPDPDPKNV